MYASKTLYALLKIYLDRQCFLQIFAYKLRYKIESGACATDKENLSHILYYNLNSFIEKQKLFLLVSFCLSLN